MSATPIRAERLWSIAAEPVGSADSVSLLHTYYADLVGRYHRAHDGRSATVAEVERAIAEEPSGHLVPPGGLFLLARREGEPVGCAGVHRLEPGTAELARVFVAPAARRTGLGSALLRTAEEAAAGVLGAVRIVLDTRADLTEARAMYSANGYREIPAYNDSPYAEHYFGKRLTP